MPFKLEFAKKVKQYQDKEKKIHQILDENRVNKSREFFKIDKYKILKIETVPAKPLIPSIKFTALTKRTRHKIVKIKEKSFK